MPAVHDGLQIRLRFYSWDGWTCTGSNPGGYTGDSSRHSDQSTPQASGEHTQYIPGVDGLTFAVVTIGQPLGSLVGTGSSKRVTCTGLG